jgi:hypothetical protein
MKKDETIECKESKEESDTSSVENIISAKDIPFIEPISPEKEKKVHLMINLL